MARHILLAIDDDIGRYDGLRRYLAEMRKHKPETPRLLVCCCRPCVAAALPNAAAVLLDYDLDSGEFCCCGHLPEDRTGAAFAAQIAAAEVPVIVTSASHRLNRLALVEDLQARGSTVAEMSAGDVSPELGWVGRLAVWGAL